ncbi:hypothetical protein H5410_022015 [Solanum commersonii]|uniref:Uncharacterized protein n=1 Tax=Solanum commersonii TaxID=4109 RepID=A0A9J5ZIL8_SOLCO|nr:hypothetical protein H5410_022015 [Solanum commersonii]
MHHETDVGLKPEFIDNVRDIIEHTMTLDILKNNGLVYDEYSSVENLQLVKEVALGIESQVLTINKYCVNGFMFQTEEVSKNKKTNNRGVYIQGDVDGIGQTIEHYEWDDNENETIEEEEWENHGIITSEEE